MSCSIEPDLPVEGDAQLLTQLFSNLLENAIGHTPFGTAIRLELVRQAAGASIVAVIADDGPGIPAGEAKKVFRRFYRLEKSRSTPGNGLGLSAVAAIVDLHKAKIVLADNKPGLRVKIIFPRTA